MRYTSNQFVVMLAVNAICDKKRKEPPEDGSTQARALEVRDQVAKTFGRKMGPSVMHVTTHQLTKSHDLKRTKVKGAGRGTVDFALTVDGLKRLHKTLGAIDSLRI